MNRRNHATWKWPMIGIMLAAAFLGGSAPAVAAGVNLVIDGQTIVASPLPVIIDGRTLVPVRLVSETLGALVEWDERSRTVLIKRGSQQVKLWVDNRLVNYTDQDTRSELLDVAPRILENRTFVPLRWVATALGVAVGWDGAQKTVYIDSGTAGTPAPPAPVSFESLPPGQVITGSIDLQLAVTGGLPAGAAEVRFLLLDPETGRGPLVARGSSLTGVYRLAPDPARNGSRLLAAAVYNGAGNFLTGTVAPVVVAVEPQVKLKGLLPGQTVATTLPLAVELNFSAEYVQYEITNQGTGKVKDTGKVDPYGPHNWTPLLGDNGNYTVRATAYDLLGQSASTPAVAFTISVSRRLEVRGITSGATIDKPVTITQARNFPVQEVQYILQEPGSGKEVVIAKLKGTSSYRWFPTPEQAGTWELRTEVVDEQGKTHSSKAVPLKVAGSPALFLDSVGPNQVLTGAVKLQSLSNVALVKIEYLLINPQNNSQRVIASGTQAETAYSWTPAADDAGSWQLRAQGVDAAGKQITSQTLPVQVYTGTIYGPRPVIEKNLFQGLASDLAVNSLARTGMSAALQTAQAILETGWGQSVPVDKYSGQFSNNLFGIKGRGPAGSITSNTWEEYNGQTFRIDAAFRAYTNSAESWEDHKRLLLTADRYEPFRAVMHNGIQGAWALKRAGYATDSQYPIKLIDIIKRYQLDLLDELGI